MAGPNILTKKVQKSDVLKPTKNNLIKKSSITAIYIALWRKVQLRSPHNPMKGWIGLQIDLLFTLPYLLNVMG